MIAKYLPYPNAIHNFAAITLTRSRHEIYKIFHYVHPVCILSSHARLSRARLLSECRYTNN